MSKHQTYLLARAAVIAAATAAVLSAAPVGAADPVFDSMQSPNGPTAGNSSDFGRSIMREAERAPTLTERFGLPRISGPIPPILPPQREQPIFYAPNTTVPPPPVIRARRNTPDG
jgi:hypothetical protein